MNDLFFGTSGPRDARVAIVAESWGREEAKKQQPLVGTSGQLSDTMLADAGLKRSDVFCTNVISAHPENNDILRFFYPSAETKGLTPLFGLYPRPELIEGLRKLYQQLAIVNPRVIIAYGNYALWALCHGIVKIKNEYTYHGSYKAPSGIMAWRGSLLHWDRSLNGHPLHTPVIPTIHPAAIQRQFHLRWMAVHDIRKRAVYIARGHQEEQPNYDFTIRPTFGQVVDWINRSISLGTKRWAVDIETRGGHLACLCLATSAQRAISIPFMCVDRPLGYFTVSEERIVGEMLRFILLNRNYEIIGQFFTYDMQYLRQYLFCEPRCHLDTFVGHHLCWPGVPGGLSVIASLYNRYYRYWKDEGKEWDVHLPEEQWWHYNCIDGVATWEASYKIEAQIKRCPRRRVLTDGTVETYFVDLTERMKEQMKVLHIRFKMMNNGIAVDTKAKMEMFKDVWLELCELEVNFERMMPREVAEAIGTKTSKSPWYSSPTQLCNFFYDVCGITPVYNDTGGRRMDDDALQRIKVKEPLFRDLCTDLQVYRSKGVFSHNFLSARLDPDGRMRCEFKPNPSTFRWSSSKNAFGRGTNLQNIPRGDD